MATGNLTKLHKRKGESGFTLVELMIAIAIMAILISGSLILLAYMVRVSDENRDKTFASMQTQYVGFWISEDAVQAQSITLANNTDYGIFIEGFPLQLDWIDTVTEEWYTVKYELVPSPDNDFWQIEREQWVDDLDTGNVTLGRVIVGEYIDPNLTKCQRERYEFVSSLILEVTADVDERTAYNKYEIHPRAYSLWYPEDEEV